MSRTLYALLATLLVAAGAVPLASAKQGADSSSTVLEVSASATATGDGSTATATAECPEGTKVAGGGFNAPYSFEAIPIVYESMMTGKRSWRASVQLLDPGQTSSLTLTTYAYCRHPQPDVKRVSETATTTGELGVGPVVGASCSHNDWAIGGGFQMNPPLNNGLVRALVFDSLAGDGTGWSTRYVTGPAGTTPATTEVYCSKRDGAAVTANSDPNNRDLGVSSATADCPAGTTPSAGGFAQSDASFISFFLVYESRRVGDSWRVSGLHTGNDPGATLTSSAYCA